jgi:YfiH family protein
MSYPYCFRIVNAHYTPGAAVKQSMVWIQRSGLKLGMFPVVDVITPQLEVYFSSRAGGVSEYPYQCLNVGMNTGDSKRCVRENRRLLLNALGISRLARAEQVHGARIAVVDRSGLYEKSDGLVTTKKNLALAVSTADCYAIVIYAPSERVLGALHVGRSGAARGIIERSLALMIGTFAINIRNSIALIGPGICRDCYEVSEQHANRFPERFRSMRNGRWHLDLLSHCKVELGRAGIRSGNVFAAGLCTSCNPEMFYSYRRDGGITGRHWMLARISSRRYPLR